MGAWGTAIFSNDQACDVRNEYIPIIGNGYDDETALKVMKKFFNISEEPDEDDADFWYALASLQYRYGRLSDEVKEKALYCIDNGFTMNEADWFSAKDCKKRKEVLYKLRSDITCGKKRPFKAPKVSYIRALGEVGDVLCYHLINYSLEAENKSIQEECSYHKEMNYDDFKVETEPWYIGKYILLYISKVRAEPISKSMPELPKNEYTHIMMFDWMGDHIPDISITKNLKIAPYFVLPLKDGGTYKHWETIYLPKSKAHIRKEKYLTNLGQAGSIADLPVEKDPQIEFEMEEALKVLFRFNPDIEKKYKEMVGE